MSLVEYAHSNGRAFVATLERREQKMLGQFMTPPAIAACMARRAVAGIEDATVRVLEPAAGAGILAAAVVEELLSRPTPPERIELTLFEVDERLHPSLKRLADRMRKAAKAQGVSLTCSIRVKDFLLSSEAINGKALVDVIIANPPYLKLNKADDRATAHAYAVYGQPNIYGLFLAACARLVDTAGRYCFITPRSWLNGSYFAEVRRQMLHWLRFDSLHVFESRKDHFSEDEILQEAVILWATARAEQEPNLDVLVSRSHGIADLASAVVTAVPFARLVGADDERMIALHEEHVDPFHAWTDTLASHGLKVSTGPVVAFRATDFIRSEAGQTTVPLLWMQHIHPMRVQWPVQKKREHIDAVEGSAWMLASNQPMVVLRRFSPKEAVRRITAAPYSGTLPGATIGLENHLNYIVRPGGTMTVDEVKGLAAFLSSALVDAHFRALAGSTQINATELRKLPLPPMAQLIEIGQRLPAQATFAEVDHLVEEVLLHTALAATGAA
ncbi:hypothetical protein WM03_24685 [Burkholderia ubonensis]|uniref:Eco57I restriction-modification methylase domain-containing protein n=1 Tax=Burkholderia ubonensis TaxID=101571 RepID=UPI00075DAEE1|nr:Eco57I restriction-modification methylase domain-containing protein [Burkholderia ubonensis]KVN59750.1 hypothetical protein WJ65_02890 [Burkholderia ubonensis]KWI05189.1 hypothetical protein WM02_27605 [Burkholderia ubonensis]KWI22856.1 hypothetical protein WM03_24685 [Burkholderia ubonensis]ODQ40793.1 hypothetical protein BGV63_09320 [Burkholderia ubonensis]OJA31182.1 hypothetical protein BGV58_09295 [Burkholderia ubonensis]